MRLRFGETLCAAGFNHCVILRLLLEQGAEVNHKAGNLKTTPLQKAALHGYNAATVCLLDNGAEIESADMDGDRPIHRAIYSGDSSR